ncbi:hypothetical protein EMIHUDRAFT_464382 [Emiliania huxleyi CCMP1516]|uniref:Uncharacterized protein n=2 Tax=Emiliania huxleyi TaxID=2903 RepID=A0A0D3IXK8_EMIH1|nr:hypothetical protein EMIHUDRAFT_464382 [Emiliania huxleyi CCMP1516]EOD15993.1 hypothetical protein EMIHUDRAFT_464382 [Emiliania huxleyi CCMP1516]|eukprot:XP_005768422.1 hypothetical protein EMIHUDRAFT_464382 [Emiliania huxleyi CCMP1516]
MGKGEGKGGVSDPHKGPGCCGGCATDDPDFPADPDEAGCTDIFCLGLFLVFWVGIVGIGVSAISTGDLTALYRGADYLGNRCGVDDNNFEKNGESYSVPGDPDTGSTLGGYIWYPQIAKDLSLQQSLIAKGQWASVTLYGLCVDECPKVGSEPIEDYGHQARKNGKEGGKVLCSVAHEDDEKCTDDEILSKAGEDGTWGVYLSTMPVLNRCLPKSDTNSSDAKLCTDPPCTDPDINKPCYEHNVDVVGTTAWEISSLEEAYLCDRELDLVVSTTAKQAGAGFFVGAPLRQSGPARAAGILIFFYLFAGVAVYLAIFLLLLTFAIATAIFAYKGSPSQPHHRAERGRACPEACSELLPVGGLSTPYIDDLVTQGAGYVGDKMDEHGFDTAYVTESSMYESMTAAPLAEGGVAAGRRPADEELRIYKWMAIVTGVLLLLALIFICMASKQIKRTTALVSEGTKVIKNSPAMMFVPLASYIAQLVAVSICALIICYLWTDPACPQQGVTRASSYQTTLGWAEELKAKANSTIDIAVDPNDLLKYETAYVAFGGLWTYLFYDAIVTTIISDYHFIDQDTAGMKDSRYADNQTDLITLSQIGQVIRCNLGSMAFGSLILALISVVRIVLEYIDDQTKDVQDANILLKYALKCCKCFLMCFEKSIKFLTSYAYTFVILENRGFCSACYMSYTLLGEYATQIAINKMVCFVLYWIQSIVTPIVCFLCAYKQMTMNDEKIQTGTANAYNYYGPLVPATAIFILALMLARSFAAVYEQTVTALTVRPTAPPRPPSAAARPRRRPPFARLQVCVLHDIREYDPPFIAREMYEAFELEPAWEERPMHEGQPGEPKDASKKRPFSKRHMVGHKKGGQALLNP